ncbi:hypothetical protein AB3N59_05755 [Leptospira sp. WS92.C1]
MSSGSELTKSSKAFAFGSLRSNKIERPIVLVYHQPGLLRTGIVGLGFSATLKTNANASLAFSNLALYESLDWISDF